MTAKRRNWYVGLLTSLALVSVAVSVMSFANTATGEAPAQAGPVLRVDVGSSNGSAVHIGNGLVLSAWHVVEDRTSVSVVTDTGAGHDAEVLWTATHYDVALLRMPVDARLGSVDVSCRPLVIGEEVTAHGTPHRIDFATAWGRVASRPAPRYIWRETVAVHGVGDSAGMSGGPVLDAEGRMVGIYVGQERNKPYAFVVPATVLCDLLARH